MALYISLRSSEWVKLEFSSFKFVIVLHVQQPLLNSSIRKLGQSESFTNFASKTTCDWLCSSKECLALTAKLEDLWSLFFCSRTGPFILVEAYSSNGFDYSPPVVKVMIFILACPTIRWRMFTVPKRISVSTYMLTAGTWKLSLNIKTTKVEKVITTLKKDGIGCPLKRHLTETLTLVNNLKSGQKGTEASTIGWILFTVWNSRA